ncbi:DoxX family protein [Flavobacteriaceae bacterium S356]|uniref:DoxX family protein n=1 Tax=Asprobacillus argus TaxID=3076534 RepID=A0ABU3LHY1_9FLAO|nr:DoxX family protein [Flavobacteriaceae bacterium S356]
MKKRDTIIYYVITALFSLMILAGAITYFVEYEMVSELFSALGVPASIVYPLAIAKILGVLAIWLIKHRVVKTLAYAGFAINLTAAIIAHVNAGDGEAFGPVIPLILLIISYIFYRKRVQA